MLKETLVRSNWQLVGLFFPSALSYFINFAIIEPCICLWLNQIVTFYLI